MGYPTLQDRIDILTRLFTDIENDVTGAQLSEVVRELNGWAGSDIEKMAREAAMAPVRECINAAASLENRSNSISTTTREALIVGFHNLRPVNVQDVKNAICFITSNMDAKANPSDEGRSE